MTDPSVLSELLKLLQAGGDTATLLLVYHLWHQNRRLGNIELHIFGDRRKNSPEL